MSLSIDPSSFASEAILKSLEGERIVRVSRTAIVDALKSQTSTISQLFQDALEKANLIQSLEESNRNLTKMVYDLSDKVDSLQNTVEEQAVMVAEHEEILGSGKIEKLFVRVDALEAQMAEHEERMNDGFSEAAADRERLETQTQTHFREVRNTVKELKSDVEGLDVRANALEERMQDLGCVNRDGIFRIKGERVAVGANEVSVDEMFGGLRTEFTNVTVEFRTSIAEHTDVLEGYAPKLKLLPELIETANSNKKMFDDLGLGGDKPGEKGMLQQFADMKEDMTDVQKSLLEKCDINKMLETVELKYDEIVDHLQEAIQAAVEDEDQFKRVTEELKEMCKNLMMNKADKIALIEINERLGAAKLLQEQVQDVRQELGDKVGRNDLNEMLLVKGQQDKEEYMGIISNVAHKLERNITRKVQQFTAENMESNSFGGGFGIGGGGFGGSGGGSGSGSRGGKGNKRGGSAVGSKAFKNSPNRSQTYGAAGGGGSRNNSNSNNNNNAGFASSSSSNNGPAVGAASGGAGGNRHSAYGAGNAPPAPGGGGGGGGTDGGYYGGGDPYTHGANANGSAGPGGSGSGAGGYGSSYGGNANGGYNDDGSDPSRQVYTGGNGGSQRGPGARAGGGGGYGHNGGRSSSGSTGGGGDGLNPETISRPRLGPGGPSLGGGFQVMLPVKEGSSSSGKQGMKLPRVRSAGPGVM